MSESEPSANPLSVQDDIDRLGRELAEARSRMNALEEENEQLRERVDDLEARLPELRGKGYDAMTREERVAALRDRMLERAEDNNGYYAATYDDVINLLDGGPSPGYAYDLMELAGEAERFEDGTAPDGTRRLVVKV